jgi:hypothetical protein
MRALGRVKSQRLRRAFSAFREPIYVELVRWSDQSTARRVGNTSLLTDRKSVRGAGYGEKSQERLAQRMATATVSGRPAPAVWTVPLFA